MALISVCTAGGAAGATTLSLALALTWPTGVILAECDPAGGAILPGLFRGELPADRGLLQLAEQQAAHGTVTAAGLTQQLIPLPDDDPVVRREVLPGLTDPRQAGQLAIVWNALTQVLRDSGRDVIADLGRLGGRDTPAPLAVSSDITVLLLRPTLRQVAAAQPRIEALRRVGDATATPLTACLVGDGDYDARTVRRVLGVPIIGELPYDPRAAAALSDGTGARRGFRRSPLMRAAAQLGETVRGQLTQLAQPSGRVPTETALREIAPAEPTQRGNRHGGIT